MTNDYSAENAAESTVDTAVDAAVEAIDRAVTDGHDDVAVVDLGIDVAEPPELADAELGATLEALLLVVDSPVPADALAETSEDGRKAVMRRALRETVQRRYETKHGTKNA